MKKGFDRLKGVAAASAMGLGLLGAGSGRAAVTVTGTNTWINVVNQTTSTRSTGWLYVGNSTGLLSSASSLTTSLGFSLNTSDSGFMAYSAYSWTTDGSNTATRYLFAYGSLILAVENNLFLNPGSSVDLTDTTITSNDITGIVSGIDAQIQYYFAPDRPVVRALYSLTNTTGSPIDTRALVMGTHYDGSGDGAVIHDTSNGDTVVEDSDLWVIVNPDSAGSYLAPAGTFTNHGTGAGVEPTAVFKLGTSSNGNIDSIWGYRYPLTVPANSTVRIMIFNEMNIASADAVAEAGDFETLAAANAAGLLAGLSSTEQSEIVNYFVDDDSDTITNYLDNCKADANTDQADADSDGAGDVCDAFPDDDTETVDSDGDGVGDNADFYPDDDTRSQRPPSDSGATGLSMLFALLGVPALLRRFRKNK